MKTSVWLLFFFILFFSNIHAQNTIHTVKSGDTLNKIASQYSVSVTDIINANQLANPDLIELDQQLVIPTLQSWSDPLPYPFTSISLSPQIATQGEVQTLTVTTETRSPVTISYLGQDIPSTQSEEQTRAFLATPVLQATGQTSLIIKTINTTLRLPLQVQEGNYDVENINLSGTTSQLLSPDIVTKEHAFMENTCATFTPEQRWQAAFQHPIANPEFTSAFGTKRSYNNGPISGFHRGQDYRGKTGTAVYAAANGSVSLAEGLELYGNTVILNHGLGVCSAYMHLNETTVSKGQNIATGDLLGYVGETGLVTGSHLHFEIRVNGVPVTPQQWLDGLE